MKSRRKGLIGAGVIFIILLAILQYFKVSILSQKGLVPEKFLHAISKNEINTVEDYLQKGIDPNLTFCDSYAELLDGFSKIVASCKVSRSLLHHMITWPHTIEPEILEIFIKYGADVNIKDNSGKTLLHYLSVQPLVRDSRIDQVGKILITSGADVNARDAQGQTVLETTLCAENPNINLVTSLVDNGAELEAINPKSICDTTLLHLAARANNLVLAKFSLDQGLEVDIQNRDGQTPLHNLRGKVVGELLFDQGANPNIKDSSGQTPLMSAICLHGIHPLKAETIALLLDKGAESQTLSPGIDCGSRPSSLMAEAIGSNSAELTKVAISRGINVAEKDNKGQTFLHHTGHSNAPDVAKILLSQGANINAKDNQGYTPLHLAAIHRNFEIAQALIDLGADVNAKDNDAHTPLYHAENLFWFPNGQDPNPKATQALVDFIQRSGGKK